MTLTDLKSYGDALIMTPGWTPDTDPRLQAPYPIAQGSKAESYNWITKALPLGATLAAMCVHKEGPKDGPGFVGGEVIGDRRKAQAMRQLTFVGLDIDTGMKPEAIDAALIELGCIAVRYTTHSNMKTETEFLKSRVTKFAVAGGLDPEDISVDLMQAFMGEGEKFEAYVVDSIDEVVEDQTERGFVVRVSHCPIPKNRIVLPLAEPFVMAKEASEQKDAIAKWKKIPTMLAERLGVPIDLTGVDPSRLFYYPRHKKGRPYEVRLFGGGLFDWRSLETNNPLLDAADAMISGGKGRSKSKTEEGRNLARWSQKRAQGFQIVDLIRDHAEERIRAEVGAGTEIECPFDEDHSNAGDPEDRACLAVNAGEGVSEIFTISCRHESCQGKTNLDMLGKMLKDAWFDEPVIWDERYNALEGEQAAAEKLSADAFQEVLDSLSTLNSRSNADDIRAVLVRIDSAHVDGLQKEDWLGQIHRRTNQPKRTLSDALRRVSSALGDDRNALDPMTARILKAWGRPFKLPPKHLGHFQLALIDDRPWVLRRSKDGDDEFLFTPVQLCDAPTYVDRGGGRVLRLEVLTADDEWKTVNIDRGDLAAGGGAPVISELLRAGVGFGPRGKPFMIDLLTQAQLKGPQIFHRPGCRLPGIHLFPSGEVIPRNAGVELAAEARLTGQRTGGTFDAWLGAARAIYAADGYDVLHAAPLIGWVGPLVDHGDIQAPAYAFEGITSSGKSSLQMVGAAHYGDPKLGSGGLFTSARGTENSFELVLEKCSGAGAFLDEVSHLSATAQRNLIFLNQGGVNKGRMTRNLEARPSRRWRTPIITSGETGLAQRLRSEGKSAEGGLTVRVFPISTDNRKTPPPELWGCVTALHTNFGWSGPAFVRAMHDQGYLDSPERIAKELDELAHRLEGVAGAKDAQLLRAGRNAALPWLAGEIAMRAGLIPASFDLTGLISRLWRDARGSDLAPANVLTKAVEGLVDQIFAKKDIEIISFNESGARHREVIGYHSAYVTTNDDRGARREEVYVLRTTSVIEMAPTVTARVLWKALDDAGYLVWSPKGDSRTWSGFQGLGKGVQYVVLRSSAIEEPGEKEAGGVWVGVECPELERACSEMLRVLNEIEMGTRH